MLSSDVFDFERYNDVTLSLHTCSRHVAAPELLWRCCCQFSNEFPCVYLRSADGNKSSIYRHSVDLLDSHGDSVDGARDAVAAKSKFFTDRINDLLQLHVPLLSSTRVRHRLRD